MNRRLAMVASLARRSRRQRGAAYMEGIIVATFMIIIFGGVLYLGRYFDSKQRALEIARRCAWIFSHNACVENDNLPEYCREVVRGIETDASSDVLDQVNSERDAALTRSGAATQGGTGPQQELRGGVDDKMNEFVEMVFGEYVVAQSSLDVERPPNLAAAEPSVGASYYMPCNLRHQDPFSVAWDLFQRIIPGGGL